MWFVDVEYNNNMLLSIYIDVFHMRAQQRPMFWILNNAHNNMEAEFECLYIG